MRIHLKLSGNWEFKSVQWVSLYATYLGKKQTKINTKITRENLFSILSNIPTAIILNHFLFMFFLPSFTSKVFLLLLLKSVMRVCFSHKCVHYSVLICIFLDMCREFERERDRVLSEKENEIGREKERKCLNVYLGVWVLEFFVQSFEIRMDTWLSDKKSCTKYYRTSCSTFRWKHQKASFLNKMFGLWCHFQSHILI